MEFNGADMFYYALSNGHLMIVFYSSQSVTRKIVQYCAVDSELIFRLSFTTCLKMNQLEIFLSLSIFVFCVSIYRCLWMQKEYVQWKCGNCRCNTVKLSLVSVIFLPTMAGSSRKAFSRTFSLSQIKADLNGYWRKLRCLLEHSKIGSNQCFTVGAPDLLTSLIALYSRSSWEWKWAQGGFF